MGGTASKQSSQKQPQIEEPKDDMVSIASPEDAMMKQTRHSKTDFIFSKHSTIRNQSLQSFDNTIIFDFSRQMNINIPEKFINLGVHPRKSSKILEIHFARVTDRHIEGLGSYITRYLGNPLHLKIFLNESITRDGIKILGFEIAKHLTNLRRLEIDTSSSDSRISSADLTNMAKKLERKLAHLQEVSLITIKEDLRRKIDPLRHNFELPPSRTRSATFFHKIQHLKTNFINRDKSAYQDVKKFGTKISRDFTSLKYSILNFENCENYSDVFLLEDISTVSDFFFNLDQLKICLKGCDKITDKSLEYLGIHTRKALRLQQLVLDFTDCKLITGAGLKDALFKMRIFLDKIKAFTLSIPL